MNLTLQILGTASAMPISDRNPSAQVLSVHGRLFLIDCGEGTQQQIRRMHISFLKIEAIFLSHIHGDHLFGIFGLLSTMAMYGRTADLPIYAPQSFGPVLKFFMSYFGDDINFKIEHHPLNMKEPQVVHSGKYLDVTAFPLRHKIDCYGFRFGDSYAYCSDTTPFPALPDYVRGVHTLYHEATYQNEMEDKAAARFHSTTSQACGCAVDAGVERLLVGHYSSRIRDFEQYIGECRAIFANTIAAQDGDIYEIPYISTK